MILNVLKRPRDHGKEIARFGMRVVPDGEMVRPVFPGFDLVAVREQHGILRLKSAKRYPVDRQVIRPVEEVGNAPKALRFALGAQRIGRGIKAVEFGIGRRVDLGLNLQCGVGLTEKERQRGVIALILVLLQRLAVHLDADEIQFLPVQDERPIVVAGSFDCQAGADARFLALEVKLKRNGGDPKVRRLVILQVYALRAFLFCCHQTILISKTTKAATATKGNRTAGQSRGASADSFIKFLTPGKNQRMMSRARTPSRIFSQVASGSIKRSFVDAFRV